MSENSSAYVSAREGISSTRGRSARRALTPRAKAAYLGALVTVALGVTVSCSSPAVEGSAIPPKGGAPVPVGLLDPGQYPVKPAPRPDKAGAEDVGRLVEAHRMASAVVGPWEIGPEYVHAGMLNGVIQIGGLSNVFTQDLVDVAVDHGYVVGFSSERAAGDTVPRDKHLTNLVMRFPDPGSASAAATSMASKFRIGDKPATPVSVPGHADTTAVTGDDYDKSKFVGAFTAHGPFVLYQYSEAPTPDAALAPVGTILDKQVLALDQFKPTDVANLADLPPDSTGLLGRTVPLKSPGKNGDYVYDLPGSLHFMSAPVDMAAAENDAGVDLVSTGAVTVFQTKDPAGAERLLAALTKDATGGNDPSKPADPVPYLRVSQCFTAKKSATCYATVDRYVVEADSSQLPDAQQKAAAQYRMLTSS